MISLDKRLEGEKVMLRRSMIKFESPDQDEIEICRSASCLPMRLNRQFIKIMEDLSVDPEVFMNLQNKAVEKLRQATNNPMKAADFLESNKVATHARVSELLRKLCQIDLNPLGDPFLRGVVELTTIMQLRELKYRARIPVEHGVTLFGIMDETDTLEEGQIYCCTDKFVVTKKVMITRAPALHPGDVRIATAVPIPKESPLNALHNCVIFSQRGARDLPSQLSGGDLDGDLYQITWDDTLLPKFTEPPADYPRVQPIDIKRAVERDDMTDFFIKFMENDQLGRIANMHQQLADINPGGTLHPDCLTLAELHSDAVDFSKTGIPADMKKIPRYRNFKPDFMAPGPRYKIETHDIRLIDEQNFGSIEDEEGDIISKLDPESSKVKYYESNRILGKLYRAIDEYKFLEELQEQSRVANKLSGSEGTLMNQIWAYVKQQTQLIEWKHHNSDARDIRDA
jgi:RNA dependent RNA polymerase